MYAVGKPLERSRHDDLVVEAFQRSQAMALEPGSILYSVVAFLNSGSVANQKGPLDFYSCNQTPTNQ